MKKKQKICLDCIHYSACSAWNCGSLANADAGNCVNYEKSETLALELLKAQEAKKVGCIRHLTKVMKGICPTCEMEIESVRHGKITRFCKFCGRAVKWE